MRLSTHFCTQFYIRIFLVVCFLFTYTAKETLFAQGSPKREFRGVWLSSVFNLDFPVRATDSPETQRADFINILEQHRQMGINAVFVQIRPSSDALYQSAIEPWSQWLTGAQGRAPQPVWDPLEFMVEEAHKRGMEFHAWFNPFRSVVSSASSVAESHISRRRPEWHLAYTSPFRLLNPGLPEVRSYVLSVIMDVLRRYDIDGVHFDDYFYPYEGTTNQDAATFTQHSRGFSNVADWRRDNVNIFVKAVSDSIRAVKPFVKFGISPFGIWRSGTPSGTSGLDAYSVIYCDATAWLRDRTVDYIVPQLYWKFGGGQDFARLMPWWNSQAQQAGRQMYSGLGAYRLTDVAWTSEDITRQVDFNRQQGGAGVMFFSSNSLTRNLQGLRTALLGGAMRTKAIPPVMKWKDSIVPNSPLNLRVERISVSAQFSAMQISWNKPAPAADGDTAVKYVVYRALNGAALNLEDPNAIIAITSQTSLLDTAQNLLANAGRVEYAVTALDRLSNESQPQRGIFVATSVNMGSGTETLISNITPNPAETLATVSFTLARSGFVKMEIIDNLGRRVLLLKDMQMPSGVHTTEVALDDLASGLYFVRFLANGVSLTKPLVVRR